MNPKRWIYVGVLALSAIAFVVDRAFLAEPETASAAESLSPARKDKAARDTSPDLEEPGSEIDPTLDRLEQLPEVTLGRDVFALSGAFLARQRKLQEEAERAAEAKEAQAIDPAETFAARHTLQTTLVGPELCLAVVDGQVVRVGDTFDGFRLVKIDSYRVKFRHDPGKAVVVLSLPSQPE